METNDANSVTTYLLDDGWSLIEERDVGDNVLATYIHGAAIDEILVCNAASSLWYHHDGLGSTVALTDNTGALAESYTYDVYGAASFFDSAGNSQPSSLVSQRFLFTGREYLADLGLFDYRNRFYSPSLGRFLQTDPIGFEAGDVNLFRYLSNQPTGWTDPFGLRPKWLDQTIELAKTVISAVLDTLSGPKGVPVLSVSEAAITCGENIPKILEDNRQQYHNWEALRPPGDTNWINPYADVPKASIEYMQSKYPGWKP